MEYAISIIVVFAFWLIYKLRQPKLREKYFQTLDEEIYISAANLFVAELTLPQNGGGLSNATKFNKIVKKLFRKLKHNKNTIIASRFCELFDSNKKIINAMTQTKFEQLSSLPSIKKEARVLKIARFCLGHSKYIFSDDRISIAIDAQNKIRTLTVDEISNLKMCCKYVLLEKLAFLSQDIIDLIKMEKLAKKYAHSADTLQKTPIFNSLKHNKIFLSMCAEEINFDCDKLLEKHTKNLEDAIFYINNICDSFSDVTVYNFNKLYRPLGLLCDFEGFNNATENSKKNFLMAISKFSNKENLDEYVYTDRLINLAKRTKLQPIACHNFDLPFCKFAFVSPKQNDVMLAKALLSSVLMTVMFDKQNKKSKKHILKNKKSTLESGDINSTFANYYENYVLNFGISVADNHLRMSPSFPKNVEQATVCMTHNGVTHTINVVAGKKDEIRLCGTLLHGVSDIVLGLIPLNIQITVPSKNE